MAASSSPNNVIALSDFDARRTPSGAEARRLLRECRDLAAETLARSLSSMMDKIEETLFELSEQAVDRERSNLYMNARGLAGKHRALLEQRFRQQFVTAFDAALDKGEEPSFSWGSGELSLMDDNEFEESLAVKNMAGKLKANCSEELSALDQRMGALLQRQALEDESSPLSPKLICETFQAACDALDAELDVKLIILRLFEQFVAGDVRSLYHELNKFLIDRNVLPKIPLALRQRPAANQNYNPLQNHVGASSVGAGANPASQQAAPKATQEQVELGLLHLLQHLTQKGHFSLPAGMEPAGVGLAVSGVLPVLDRLQHGELPDGIRAESKFDWSAGEAVLATPNLLRQLKADVLDGQTNQMESLTIDIVAMLFDYIFDEHDIPAEIKALLGRLQIPVLKVALLDAKFFSKKHHPARRLLDALAQASLGWSGETAAGERFRDLVADIVATIVEQFADDVVLFENQLARLESFLAAEQADAERAIIESARVIFAQEQLELARGLVEQELRSRLTRSGVPAVVRDYLASYWGAALLDAYQQGGLDGEAWNGALKTMDDLIWSTEPKVSTEDRIRLVNLLQPMLRRLEDTMLSQGASHAEKEQFLSGMVTCHASAIKAGLRTSDADALTIRQPVPEVRIELPPAPVVDIPLDLTPVQPSADMPVLTEEVPLDATPEAEYTDFASMGGDRAAWLVTQLRRGTWVDFKDEDGKPLRLKLAWVSPHRGIYLFTNRFGGNALSIQRDGLVTKFREGRAAMIDDSALTERAVTAVMDRLQSVVQ